MKKISFSFPLVHYEKDELIDISEVWSMDEKRNIQVTSTVGYVPLEKRVNAMINAGLVLEDMKDDFYGVSDDEDFDGDLVQDFDSKIELKRNLKERSERLKQSFESKEVDSGAGVSEDSSEETTATEDSSGVKKVS